MKRTAREIWKAYGMVKSHSVIICLHNVLGDINKTIVHENTNEEYLRKDAASLLGGGGEESIGASFKYFKEHPVTYFVCFKKPLWTLFP